jgi:hypothetical protein
MPARKMRVEVSDNSGNRYTITFEGQLTREKALHLLDLVELLGGVFQADSEPDLHSPEITKFDKLRLAIEKYLPIVWFSSKDAQSVYEDELKEPISLSTVSTYLSRMVDRGTLAKGGKSSRRLFKIKTDLSSSIRDAVKSDT